MAKDDSDNDGDIGLTRKKMGGDGKHKEKWSTGTQQCFKWNQMTKNKWKTYAKLRVKCKNDNWQLFKFKIIITTIKMKTNEILAIINQWLLTQKFQHAII